MVFDKFFPIFNNGSKEFFRRKEIDSGNFPFVILQQMSYKISYAVSRLNVSSPVIFSSFFIIPILEKSIVLGER